MMDLLVYTLTFSDSLILILKILFMHLVSNPADCSQISQTLLVSSLVLHIINI